MRSFHSLPIHAVVLGTVALLLPSTRVAAEPPAKTPIVFDTDIGSDVDDAFALALVLASPELDLVAVTTVGDHAEDRAWMVCRMLTAIGRRDVPVAWGRDPQPADAIEGQIQYRRHPAVLYNRTTKPAKESAVDVLYAGLKERQGQLTIVATGPLTNIARLLADHPDCKPWIKRIVLMGGSVRLGYEGKLAPEAEWNIKLDPPAARAVFASGLPLTVAPLDATTSLKLEEPLRRKLFAACTPLTFQVQALYQLWDKPTPTLYDPAAVALSFNEQFFTMEALHLEVGDDGFTRVGNGEANAHVATAVRADAFLKWYVERVSAGEAVLPREPANRSALVERGAFPNRVHCFEDYETDIEKRWWMSGKAETDNVPSGSTRACRGVLTQDFDDLQGDLKTMYSAVIFNPVPGPPMGKKPCVSFRYWLKGTDTLRVQIYSLTKGYHRYLSLTGLPQEKWQSAAVDMTQARRPDGSGGPLSEDERIDDVQFYTDPRAELLINDLVLYDRAAPDEKRPFPKSIQYTGWFDTGKQGKEWLGAFEIPDQGGYFGKAARSVDNPDGAPWIRLQFHGERPLGETTRISFRYRLTGADALRVRLVNRTQMATHTVELNNLKNGDWAEASADFTADPKPRRGDRVDELQFLLPRGAELLVDDVLLCEPGKE